VVDRHVSGTRLSAFLDDELLEDQALALTRHVSACDRCRAELEGLRSAREALRRLPRLQAPVLTSGVAVRNVWRQRAARRARMAAAAALVPAAVLGIVYLAGAEHPGEVVPPTDRFLVEHVARTGGGPVPTPVVAPPVEPLR
jgi:anti-sigma factor RsiW